MLQYIWVSPHPLKALRFQHSGYYVSNFNVVNFILILGGYDMEEKAARAYDLAALKYWGPSTHINFSVYFVFLLHSNLVFLGIPLFLFTLAD